MLVRGTAGDDIDGRPEIGYQFIAADGQYLLCTIGELYTIAVGWNLWPRGPLCGRR
jgi:hypothetical protein